MARANGSDQGLMDRLAFALRGLAELVPGFPCKACTENTPCQLHRRKAAAIAALHEYDGK